MFLRLLTGTAHGTLSALISRRRVQQIIALAFPAPDIVRHAMQGRQPAGFTTRWFLRHRMPSD